MAWIKTDNAKTIEEVILRNTGYKTIEDFLGLNLKVYSIKFIKEACDMITEAIKNGWQITIVGDYDADGVTASSIMYDGLQSLGAKVKVRIPRRLSEGYGLSEKIIDEIDSGLVITVDNGIVAFDAIKKAKEKGLKVIITDHHLPDASGELPPADIVIDPHLKGTADFEDYCGAGIAYKLMQALIPENKQLLKKLSCFAAIGTVADVMPLVEENRLIVKEGLKNMVTYNCRTSGLYSLLRLLDLDRVVTEENIGYKIGPCINAAGRLYDDGAMKAFEIISYDGKYSEDYAKELVEINELRKKMTEEAMVAIADNIRDNCLYGDYPLVIYQPGIHEGLVGIIAGKLTELHGVPTIVFTDSSEEGILKGSGRTECGVHLKNLLDSCSDVFVRYGGHAEAAGVSVEKARYDEMCEKLMEKIPDPVIDPHKNDTFYDLEITVNEVPDVLEQLKKYAPFGNGNPNVIFKINGFSLSPRYSSCYGTLGEDKDHLKLYGIGMDAIGFSMVEKYQDMGEPKNLTLVGSINENYFMGRIATQITLLDFCDAGKKVGKTKLALLLEEKAKNRHSTT